MRSSALIGVTSIFVGFVATRALPVTKLIVKGMQNR
jgi:hypothetical protein